MVPHVKVRQSDGLLLDQRQEDRDIGRLAGEQVGVDGTGLGLQQGGG